jgi:hypothetical protein
MSFPWGSEYLISFSSQLVQDNHSYAFLSTHKYDFDEEAYAIAGEETAQGNGGVASVMSLPLIMMISRNQVHYGVLLLK